MKNLSEYAQHLFSGLIHCACVSASQKDNDINQASIDPFLPILIDNIHYASPHFYKRKGYNVEAAYYIYSEHNFINLQGL